MPTPTYWTQLPTPLGPMTVAASPAGLVGAWFDAQKHFNGPQADWLARADAPWLSEAREQFAAWFAGARTRFDLPLAPVGTPFQQAVWQALARIPYGQTQHYGALAAALGRPQAARAVGAATGRNPLSIIVPCHRLLGRDGALTGYAGGLERKRALLAWEALLGRV